MNADFVKALAEVQAELPAIKKSGTNPHFNSKFAPLDEVNPAALKVLSAHGFAWVTMPKLSDGEPVLEYRLMHVCGDELVGEMPLMMKNRGPQEQGSAITYARRYSIQAVLGLVTDEDDDGQAASRPAEKRATKQKAPATRASNSEWEVPPWNKGAWMDTVQASTTKEQLAGLWTELAHAVSSKTVEQGSQELSDLEFFWKERAEQIKKEAA